MSLGLLAREGEPMQEWVTIPRDELFNWLTGTIAVVSGVGFPLAGEIPKLREFFFDTATQRIYGAFATILSVGLILYFYSRGVYLVRGPEWYWGLYSGLACLFLYYFVLLCFRENLPTKTGRKIAVILPSFLLYIALFLSFTYAFNKLALLNLSKFSISGHVYVVTPEKNVALLKDSHVLVSLYRAGDFLMARRVTDNEGKYDFTLNLYDLSRAENIEVTDPAGRYHEEPANIPSLIIDNVVRDFVLEPVDP